jgi:hypothetical protein
VLTDLLSRYIEMTDDNGEPFTDTYLRDIVLNFMYCTPAPSVTIASQHRHCIPNVWNHRIAGRDTTAQALTVLTRLTSHDTLNPFRYHVS